MRFLKIKKSLFHSGSGLFLTVSLALSPNQGLAREIKDATQAQVQITDNPKRIVTLAPSLGELAADLLGSEIHRIIGVSEYTDYPPILKKVDSIGPYHQFNLEKVLSLKPDLVFATLDGNPREKVLHLRELGIPVVIVATENFQEIQNSIQMVADSLGRGEVGKQMVQQFQTGIGRIKERSKKHAPLKVMLQVGADPLIVAGGKSFLHQAAKLIGAKNIYEDAKAHYPKPSLEDVLHQNPDVIVVVALNDDTAHFQRVVKKWYQFSGLKAVQEHKVLLLRNDGIIRPTLRILEGLSLLERAVYGK